MIRSWYGSPSVNRSVRIGNRIQRSPPTVISSCLSAFGSSGPLIRDRLGVRGRLRVEELPRPHLDAPDAPEQVGVGVAALDEVLERDHHGLLVEPAPVDERLLHEDAVDPVLQQMVLSSPLRSSSCCPTRQTLTFRGDGVHVIDLDHKGRESGAVATRAPIRQEEVTFKNGDVTLAGTLLLPAAPPSSKAKRPALVFVHGSGAQSREMYWGLGYLYAARGFAVLAYDKRGVGKSTGNWREASFQDLADDAVAGAKFLQARADIAANQIGFWGQSQGGWIAPLAASRFPEVAFAVALSGGGLTPADTELFDSEYELTKAGYTADEVKEALAWQRLKNEIIVSPSNIAKWDEYAKARAIAKDKKWYRHQGIDIFGPEKPDHPFWAFMRSSYFYDPAPTLRASKAPLLAIFGELDTPEGVKANVSAIRQIMDQAGRRDYTVKVYPNGSHNLMEVPPDNPKEWVRLKRFPPGFFETMVDWTTTQVRRRGSLRR